MLQRIIAVRPALAKPLVERASSVLGRDLLAHHAPENPAPFATNRDLQVGVFVVSHLHMLVAHDDGVDAGWSLGLSLGEYNHLVHIGALSFDDALRLVDARGAAYDDGPDGAMAAVFPLELDVLQEIVVRARAHGFLEIGNYNSPTQHVLSGERAAVDAALLLLEDEQFIQGRIIEARIPMHSSRFLPAASAFRPALERAAWKAPVKPYVANVAGAVVDDPTPAVIIELLFQHVFRPVLWRRSIELVAARVPDAAFVEVGPGNVLFNLLQRKWLSSPRFATEGRDGLRGLAGPRGGDVVVEVARAS